MPGGAGIFLRRPAHQFFARHKMCDGVSIAPAYSSQLLRSMPTAFFSIRDTSQRGYCKL